MCLKLLRIAPLAILAIAVWDVLPGAAQQTPTSPLVPGGRDSQTDNPLRYQSAPPAPRHVTPPQSLGLPSQQPAPRATEHSRPLEQRLDLQARRQVVENAASSPAPRELLSGEPDSTPPPAAKPPQHSVTAEKIEELAKAVQAADAIDEATKADLSKRYKTASEWLASARDASAKAAEFEADIKRAPDVQQLKSELEKPQPEPKIQIAPDLSFAQLEQLAAEAEARLSEAQQTLAKREEELKRRTDRKAELTKLLEETKQKLDEANKKLTAAPPSGETAEMTTARRTELEARIISLESQQTLYKAEVKRSDALAELFPLQRDLAKRERNLREKELAAFQQLVSRYRQIESQRQAQEARRQVEMAHPALRDLAEHNAALAEKRKKTAESISQLTGEVKQIDKRLELLKGEFEKATTKVEKGGHSSTVGLMLRKQRDELPAITDCEARIRFVEFEMPRANLDRLELEEEREELGDMEAAVARVMATMPEENAGSTTAFLEETARLLLQTKRDLIDSLDADYDTYLSQLSELELSNRSLISETRQFTSFIDEHVLWIRSADRMNLKDGTEAAAAVLSLVDPRPWIGLAKSTGIDTFQQPIMAMAVLIGAVLLITLQTRLRARVRRLCETKSATAGLRFLPTVESLTLAALAALQWPLLAYYFGWRMTTAEQTTTIGLALGPALQYAACLFWFSVFARHVCRHNGIAETHFGWSSYSLNMARREMRWLTFLGIPLAATVVFTQLYRQGEWTNSLGRIAFLAVMLVLTTFFHSLLGGKVHVLREAIVRQPSGWLSRVRTMTHLFGVGVPLVLAALAACGYYYSAQQLAYKLQTTMGVVAALVLLHAVGARWFLVKRRNLAMQQARERQQQAAAAAEAAAAAAAAGTETGDTSPPVPIEGQHPDLTLIHGKLMLLLRHAITVLLLGGSWFIWSDVLPALRVLDRVVLWEKTVEVTESIIDASGNEVRQKTPKDIPTTLRHAIIASVFLLATFLLGKNLPALLEITVLNRLPLDLGGRHAVSVILHYTVALSGFLLACRTLNITWSSVQWLAAGMTVGLGFGLQEVFANFVSGMILLFERPIRVGDIITLGDITGAVTNIRIRATTVTNWDRKELIVPNKELITGRLLNWTLSDTTNRIVIPVGVAYKSDPEKTREILFGVLREHPNVLTDPAPNVTFEGFGDSALNFVIRCFLASMDIRLATIHELHSRIHRRLGEAGIEIAFPQRDINVRYFPAVAQFAPPVSQTTSNRSAEAA